MYVGMLLIPVLMLLCGFFMDRFPPKRVNGWIGYRSKRSRMNAETWMFANRCCGRLWIKLGLILLPSTGVVSLSLAKEDAEAVFFIVEAAELVVLIGSVIPVEISLRRTFDENGIRR